MRITVGRCTTPVGRMKCGSTPPHQRDIHCSCSKQCTVYVKKVIYSVQMRGHAKMQFHDERTCRRTGVRRAQTYRCVGVRTCGCAGIWSYGHADMWMCRRMDVQICGHAGMRICRHTGVLACGRADLRMYGRAGVRMCGRTGVRACRHTDVRVYGCPDV